MPRVYVQFAGFDQLSNTCQQVSVNVSDIQAELSNIVRRLDWDIRCQKDIESSANRLVKKIEGYSSSLKAYQSFLLEAKKQYQQLNAPAPSSSISPWASGVVGAVVGAVIGESQSASDSSNQTGGTLDGPGYEWDDSHPGISGWLGHGEAKVETDTFSGSVDAYVGYAEADTKVDGSLMETKTLWKKKNGKWEKEEITELLTAEIAAGVTVSAISAEGKMSTGDDNFGADVNASGSLLNAEASAKGNFSIGEKGVDASVSGKALVSAVEGEASGTLNILGLEITVTAGGYAGAVGVEGKFGIEDNKFVVEGGVAAVFGASLGIEIGLNDTGWDNFVDFITFWD